MPKCSENRILQFLADDLTPAEQQLLEQHLADCKTCCKQLEDSTADHDWWQHASKLLPDSPHDLNTLRIDEDATSEPETLDAAVQTVLHWLTPTDDPKMLGRVGNYEIVGVVGAGGMSVVLKAVDPALNRFVAIKVLAPHLATSGAARKRFGREAQAAAAIVHENVIAIHGVEEARGLPFLVMPYEKGESLQRRIDLQGPLELKEILRIAKQTAEGLAAAHAQGLVHRDVKPANILLGDGVERVKITDFGLARAADDASLTRTGTIAGTPQYMSPEQARGETIDHRSDLFSLGSVIYAMCTGRAPFRADSSYGVLRRISDTLPSPIQDQNNEIPSWLCRLVDRLHSKSPAGRYASADEVAADLEQCLAHTQQPATEPLPAQLASLSSRSWRSAAVVLATAVAVLAAFSILANGYKATSKSESAAQSSDISSDEEAIEVGEPPTVGKSIPRQANEAASQAEWEDGTDDELERLSSEIRLLELELESQIGTPE